MTDSFDGFSFTTGGYGVPDKSPYSASDRRLQHTAHATRAGGALMIQPPTPRKIPYSIQVIGTSATDMETKKDALLKVLTRPRRTLISSFANDRSIIASMIGSPQIVYGDKGPAICLVHVTFESEDAYWSATNPDGSTRTLSLALMPGETTAYRQLLSITPAGTAPIPLRAVITNQSGGVTPYWTSIRNLTLTPDSARPLPAGVGGGTSTAFAAGNAVVIDGPLAEIWSLPLSNIIGWWPFDDASGTVLDFSSNSRDLTANGTLTYLQDGLDGRCSAILFDGVGGYLDSASTGFQLTGDISVGIWVRGIVAGFDWGLIGKSSANAGYLLRKTSGDVFTASVGNGTTTRVATGLTTFAASTWYFVVLTWTAATNTISLYVNGLLEAQTSGAAFTVSNGSNNFRVGAPHNMAGTAEFFAGRLTMPFVMNSVLSLTQIQSIYNRGLWAIGTPPTDRLFGTYPYLDPRYNANSLEVRGDHATTAPTFRLSLLHRGKYE